MGGRKLADIETDGLYAAVSKVHCLVVHDVDTGHANQYGPEEVEAGLEEMSAADMLIGHNLAQFDLPVIEKLYPGWRGPRTLVDTLSVSLMMFHHDLRQRDFKLRARQKNRPGVVQLPGQLVGRHSLEAWGYRIGEHKDTDFDPGDWQTYTPEMLEYCAQDVAVNVKLFHWLCKRPGWSLESFIVESRCAYILGRQMRNGVSFDVQGAKALLPQLTQERTDALVKCQEAIEPFYIRGKVQVPKRNMRTRVKEMGELGFKNVEKDCPYTEMKYVEFNPGSDAHVRDRLKKLYGWKHNPQAVTKTGLPKVDEDVLSDLVHDIPIVRPILEWRLANKRLSQLSEGKEAWLKQVDAEGRIYGSVKTTGAITNRMSHSKPNLAQVPKVGSPYGKEFRSLFGPRPGWVLVGADASGLELRMLAHYLARFDGGRFAKEVHEGDPHTFMMQATLIKIRDHQKTFTYALIYGAGDGKLGLIIIEDLRAAKKAGLFDGAVPPLQGRTKRGKAARNRLMKGIPAFGLLQKSIQNAVQKGFLQSLDGRRIYIRSGHMALNTLLQGGGAVVMKLAQVVLDGILQDELGLVPGQDYEFCLTVHDEWQLEARGECAEAVGKAAVDAIQRAGRLLSLRCPLDGEFKVGANWAETH